MAATPHWILLLVPDVVPSWGGIWGAHPTPSVAGSKEEGGLQAPRNALSAFISFYWDFSAPFWVLQVSARRGGVL